VTELAPEPNRLNPRKLAALAALAAAGGACGFLFALVTKDLALGWADELAGIVALVCLATAVVAGVMILRRSSEVDSFCGWMQVATLVLAGVMLLLPMYAPEAWPQELVFGAVLVLLALQTAANVALWRASDELLRRVTVETGAACFWSLQFALFVYAVAERLGLASGVSAWGLTAVLMAVYVLVSSIVAVRRGLGG
jgi:hypothetical protein